MITQFVSYFESLGHAKDMIITLENFVETFSEEYVRDGSARNALIDSVVEYLQTLKGKNAAN